MNVFRLIPLSRPVIPFTAGIIACALYPCELPVKVSIPLFAVSALMLFACIKKKVLFGFSVPVIFAISGYAFAELHIDKHRADAFTPSPDTEDTLILRITEPPEEKEKTVKTFARINCIFRRGNRVKKRGKLLLYFDKKCEIPDPGDVILVKSRVNEIESPKNPGEFDYKQYLFYRNVYYSLYLKKRDVKRLEKFDGFSLTALSHRMREDLLNRLRGHFTDPDDYAVASALILGYKNDISDETRDAFSGAGAMHVLAVSGLHVGIIYLILQSFFRIVPHFKNKRLIKSVILLIGIWSYAFITGLSASVIRASSMFTFVVIGIMADRNSNIYNTIAASALGIFVIFGPFKIMEIGMQLSYLAVLGIVFFHPRISGIIEVNNKFLKYIWDILCVSVAAQLATAPIAVHTFGLFPNYFLASNLLVIPSAFLILTTGILTLSLSALPQIAVWPGKLLNIEVLSLNRLVEKITEMPYATTYGLSLGPLETVAAYLFIVTVTAWIVLRLKSALFFGLVLLSAFLIGQNAKQIRQLDRDTFTIYAVRHHSAAGVLTKGRLSLFADSGLRASPEKINFVIPDYKSARKTVADRKSPFTKGGSHYFFGDKLIYTIDAERSYIPRDVPINVLWIKAKTRLDTATLKDAKIKTSVIDGGASFYERRDMENLLLKAGIEVHDVIRDGAFTVTID